MSQNAQAMSQDAHGPAAEDLDREAVRYLQDPESWVDPYPFYTRIREAAPVYRTSTGVWLVTGYDEAQQFYRDKRLSVMPVTPTVENVDTDGAPGQLTDSIFGSMVPWTDGAEHARLRASMSKPFTARAMSAMRPRAEAMMVETLDTMAADGATAADYRDLVAFPFPRDVVCHILGIDRPTEQQIADWWVPFGTSAPSVVANGMRFSPARYAETERILAEFVEFLAPNIEQRRRNPTDDLLSSFVEAQAGGELSDAEVASQVLVTFIGAYETTANSLANGMFLLLRDPAQYQMLVDNPTVAARAVEEVLRFEGSSRHASPRWALEDIEVGGQLIGRGDQIILGQNAANHDARHFAGAERFDINHDQRDHVAFGAGRHFCAGAALARLELEVAFVATAAHFPRLQLDGDPTWAPDWAIRKITSLPVRWD